MSSPNSRNLCPNPRIHADAGSSIAAAAAAPAYQLVPQRGQSRVVSTVAFDPQGRILRQG